MRRKRIVNLPSATGSVTTAVVLWLIGIWSWAHATRRSISGRCVMIETASIRGTTITAPYTCFVSRIASIGVCVGLSGQRGSTRCGCWCRCWFNLFFFLFRLFRSGFLFAASLGFLLFYSCRRRCSRMIRQESALKRLLLWHHFNWTTRTHVRCHFWLRNLFRWCRRRIMSHSRRWSWTLRRCAGIGAGRSCWLFGRWRGCCGASTLGLLTRWRYWSIWFSAVSLTKIHVWMMDGVVLFF